MYTSGYDMPALFKQLGLDNDQASIDAFIRQHNPLPDGVRIHQAAFWNESQARFLCEEIARDAAWTTVVDELSERLRCCMPADPCASV
ncbi:DUF2789 domain-containing protein [Brachymonas denitrificans]|jgi:hypothetical protein|uniref:DUF2789 domain-containing protein n=1 Tax=Brachymonas denitrificans DSM 15123 TaxID=1121117 RepID=A0A1H8DI15_9BURK|nr:DUF2789 domain-containing protein [Brachymonas denitrificans]SEN06961.1 Protein of unknown function [Brachymonas denitrificans DSM 15123]